MNSTNTNEVNYQSSQQASNAFEKKKMKKSSSDLNLLSVLEANKGQRIRGYEIIKEIGKGAYGTVHLAKRERDSKRVALKVLDKLFLSRNLKVNEALVEKIILSMCDHPGIIKIISTFTTKNKLFYVLEYVQNRDLDFIMRKFGSLSNELALFYIAEIVQILEYLHITMKISHNDLKPSNIMLDENYHLKFIDFSTAKIVNKKFDPKQKEFVDCVNYIDKEVVGTAEYVSPEMISQNITDYRTNDIWALGIMTYYFYHGRTPFKGSNDFKTFEKIKTGKYILNQLISDEAKDLISHLLVVNVKERYTIEEVKQHPFFKKINWDTLREETVPISKDLLVKFSNKLSTGDSNTDFWSQFCMEFNGLANREYDIDKLNDYNILEDFYYGKENVENEGVNNNKIRKLVYEGILTKIGIINKLVKIKLFSDKIVECWNNKENNIYKVIQLNKSLLLSIENEVYIKMTSDNFAFTFKTTKLEALKWYNYFNQVIYS